MSVTFRASRNSDRVFEILGNTGDLMQRAVRQAMFNVGHSHIREAQRAIRDDPKTGRTYVRVRSGRRRLHKASAAGETHANDTGATRDSLSFQLHGSYNIEFGYGVSSGKVAPDYAESLEFGRNARPTLRNALTAEERNTITYFDQAFGELT